jgi:arylsulfatase
MSAQPHILFLFTDQQRADCLGCAGHPVLQTPHMDRLASEGVRFSNTFTTSPLCVPARMSLVTGLYPHNNNCWQGITELPPEPDTFMHRLRDAGYRTCSIGKNHLYDMENCDLYANHPKYQTVGFDDIEDMPGTWGIIEGEGIYVDHLKSLGLYKQVAKYLKELEDKTDQVRRFIAEPLPLPEEHYIDAFIADRVENYVQQYSRDQPSFVYAGFQGPHEPWDAPQRYADMHPLDEIPEPIPEKSPGDWLPKRALEYQKWAQYYQPQDPVDGKRIAQSYFGKIRQIDDSVGRILAAYEKKGWLDNTWVIFSSDHGEMLGDLGRISKSVCYESAIRVPLIVRPPQSGNPGVVSDAFVELIDVHATILDAAGAEPWFHQDSLSLLPIVRGETQQHREDVLSEVHAHYMLRTQDWKIIIGREGLTIALYDLKNDPLEQINLCEHPDHQQTELELKSRLLARITSATYRTTDVDPELSSHSIDSDEA